MIMMFAELFQHLHLMRASSMLSMVPARITRTGDGITTRKLENALSSNMEDVMEMRIISKRKKNANRIVL